MGATLSQFGTEKAAAERVLVDFLGSKQQAAAKVDADYAELVGQLSRLVLSGGKRLRPILTLLAYRGFGGQDEAAIMTVAASLELFHIFLLIHDDIIDQDDYRRGELNISGYYYQEFADRQLASSWALLAGDLCYGLSQELLLNSGLDADKLRQASLLVQQTLFTTVGGQLLDISATKPLLEQRIKIARHKTAAYSFRLPLQLGMLLAGAQAKHLKAIEPFADNLGVAYQLQDDLLDASDGAGHGELEGLAEQHLQIALKLLPQLGFNPVVTKQLAELAKFCTRRSS